MKEIPINSFEQYIDETILKRGLRYFKKGLVDEPILNGCNEYEFIVHGTENYTVKLIIENNILKKYSCTCPYDFGSVCKHIVATLFYLQQDVLNIKVSKPSTKKDNKRKTKNDQVDEILENISIEELKTFTKKITEVNTDFRQSFLGEFCLKIEHESKSSYSQKIKSILYSVKRKGYIDYKGARFIESAIDKYLDIANKHFENEDYEITYYISIAIIDEIMKAFQYTDDSNRGLSYCIAYSINMLKKLSERNIDNKLKKDIFEYCIKYFTNKDFNSWDWSDQLIDIAINIGETSSDEELINNAIDAYIKNDDFSEYTLKKIMKYRLEFLKKFKDKKEVNDYMLKNINVPEFRESIINEHIENERYGEALSIIKEGVEIDKDREDEKKWIEYSLKIYQLINDKENSIKAVNILLAKSYYREKKYYDMLKSLTPKEDWQKTLNSIINILKKYYFWQRHTISEIYVWEKDMDKLFETISDYCDLDDINLYRKYFIDYKKEEFSNLYTHAILEFMKTNMGRNNYQIACRHIRQLNKMGEFENADQIIKQLKGLYYKRKALMEELDKI